MTLVPYVYTSIPLLTSSKYTVFYCSIRLHFGRKFCYLRNLDLTKYISSTYSGAIQQYSKGNLSNFKIGCDRVVSVWGIQTEPFAALGAHFVLEDFQLVDFHTGEANSYCPRGPIIGEENLSNFKIG